MIKPMKIALATQNLHKHREFSQMFPDITFLLPDDHLGVAFHHEETGSTYLENALGKARALYELTGVPSLADDSGLAVKALEGAPGIMSARYGGDSLSDRQRCSLLLSHLEGETDRRAWFVCCLVLVLDPLRHISVQETSEGEILLEPRGTQGFGYDPVFYVPSFGRSMAELTPEEKHQVSHRGRAARLLRPLMPAAEHKEDNR